MHRLRVRVRIAESRGRVAGWLRTRGGRHVTDSDCGILDLINGFASRAVRVKLPIAVDDKLVAVDAGLEIQRLGPLPAIVLCHWEDVPIAELSGDADARGVGVGVGKRRGDFFFGSTCDGA